jgi:segregation and condensation protein A
VLTEDYRVRLENFEGPLDLLLFLIRKSEVEISDIPVARITEQYLAFIQHIDRVDIDVAGEFLVMAATLMEVKSRMLMPKPPTPEGLAGDDLAGASQEDPRAELVQQLLAFKKYRDASIQLERRFDDWQRRFPVHAPHVDNAQLQAAIEASADAQVDIEDLELIDLVEAFRVVMETVNFDRLGEHEVKYDDTPVEKHAEDLLGWLNARVAAMDAAAAGFEIDGRPAIEFTQVFAGRKRSEMIGMFLALLHLMKNRLVSVRQDKIEGQIYLAVREPDANDAQVLAEQ